MIQKTAKHYEFKFRQEVYHLLREAYDIDAAKKIIQEKELPVVNVELAGIRNLVWRPTNGNHPIFHILDWQKIDSDVVSLDFPIILAEHPTQGPIIIDGWHRAAKAVDQNIPTIEGFYLELKDTKKIALHKFPRKKRKC